jgi:urease accessory protein
MTAITRLSLERRAGDGSTRLRIQVQQPPWKVVRAFPAAGGAALVHLHNVSGGVLGGDQLELEVGVGAGARAQITSTGATRVYRSRAGLPPARQSVRIAIAEDAILEYLPDALIPYAGARYVQTTRIDLGPGAALFWWETLAPGRLASGEAFRFELLDLRSTICVAGAPVLDERWRLEPAARPLSSAARMGVFTYLASFYACQPGRHPRFWMDVERRLGELAHALSRAPAVLWGASALRADGVTVRGLSATGRELPAGLYEFWSASKSMLTGQPAVRPRKMY